jgi:3-dehydroquinate synthase
MEQTTPAAAGAAVATGPGTLTVPVAGSAPYEVVVGHGLAGLLPSLVAGAARAVVLHAPPTGARAAGVAEALRAAGVTVRLVSLPDAEAAKRAGVAARCWDECAAAGVTRTDLVVGVGGGAVTDLAGFVAATWLRGVRWIAVPTSLLGMVDAAIGGKTGINTGAGKNLVGAFHPPAAVLADLTALTTLPRRDLVAGLAEVVKCGFIADPAILDLIEADPAAAADPRGGSLRELVARSARVKARVVSVDLVDSGPREALNYGHTLGHAIERVEGYRWRHGDAVSVGLVFAAALARLGGRLDAGTAERHRAVLAALGLPTSYRAEAWPALWSAMALDKKARGAVRRLVVLDGLARPAVWEAPPQDLLIAAYHEVARR